jgi:hypothetical protein
MFGSSSSTTDHQQGRTSAQGGNGHRRDPRAEHNHEAIVTPNLAAVRALVSGTPEYDGKHRA